ncbi:hypothetical protein DFP72DRAFT_874774 [Ephemerocybe angulata]|uniref:BZIP domain-containing protein n=1 Tax=Ephemerocybe angulata TaxID=980116 RepID=A0A8H6IFY8_9AGAR|nr:hypothetical protein DFP72DRAFT_874774 [Tulosesus angulatus]
MAPPNLQGLNIVHPTIQTDSHDLLSGQSYPDLSAQLDLWTNLAFDQDEPLNSRNTNDEKYSRKSLQEEEEEDPARSPVTTEKAVHDGHINPVTGINLGNNHDSNARQQHQGVVPPFDVSSFLAGFGIDPFSLPAAQPQQPSHPISPSLAQLLAYHSATAAAHHQLPSFGQQVIPQAASNSAEIPSSSYLRNSTAAARSSSPTSSTASVEEQPSTKRARTRKASVSTAASPDVDANPNNMSAAEDKRRRNTAASARFRLKKKEREAALEGKAKELEQKVSELERECEGLRRENGWLKGLVVGVTGAAQGPVVNPPASLMAPSTSSSSKRRRDEDSA